MIYTLSMYFDITSNICIEALLMDFYLDYGVFVGNTRLKSDNNDGV